MFRDQSVPVLLCERERDCGDGNWQDLSAAMAKLPAPPNLIVFSRLAAALRARGNLASHFRCLEPLGIRLRCPHRKKGRG
jgi:hypothetical protein